MAKRVRRTLILLLFVLTLVTPATASPRCASRAYHEFAQTQVTELDQLILESSRVWGLDPFLLKALLWVESGFKPAVVNRKSGACGIAQFTRPAFIELNRMRDRRGSSEVFTRELARDPVHAIPAAAELLSGLFNRWGVRYGITNYNGGKYRHGFAREVLRHMNRFRAQVKLPRLSWVDLRHRCLETS